MCVVVKVAKEEEGLLTENQDPCEALKRRAESASSLFKSNNADDE